MKITCISGSNILNSKAESTSLQLCAVIAQTAARKHISCEIIDLRSYALSPCTGCGCCFSTRRCHMDAGFNEIYEKLTLSDCIFFISPHYAPIPAKVSMLLEKMEQITFLHWWKDNSYRSELYHLPAGIISHGGGAQWALKSYKAMVNDTIANALETIQCRVIPFDSEWNTGISLPISKIEETDSIFPVQRYDWDSIRQKLEEYIEIVLREAL